VDATKLQYVGNVYHYRKMNWEYDADLFRDPETGRHYVIESMESERAFGGSSNSGPLALDGFLKQHPEWSKAVEKLIGLRRTGDTRSS